MSKTILKVDDITMQFQSIISQWKSMKERLWRLSDQMVPARQLLLM